METRGYTLANDEFAFLADLFGKVLVSKEIPHVIVGGIATQANTLDRMCRHHKRDVSSLLSDEGIGDSDDYLRATNAIDVALRFPEYDALKGKTGRDLEDATGLAHSRALRRINEVCDAVISGGIDNEGSYLSCGDEHIYTFRLERGGLKKLGFGVSIDDKPTGSIRLKLSRWPKDLVGEEGLQDFNPDFYDQFIQEGVPLTVPYSKSCTRGFRVLRPIDLLAIKIALDRPKDQMDIGNLVHAMQLTGEFFPTPESLRTDGYSLRERLVPCYEDKLGRFASKYGLSIPSASQGERARLAKR